MKAANVLITKQGILKLADFGLARAISINKNGQPNRYSQKVRNFFFAFLQLSCTDTSMFKSSSIKGFWSLCQVFLTVQKSF